MNTVILFSEPENETLYPLLRLFCRFGATVVSPTRVQQGAEALAVIYQPSYEKLTIPQGIALFINKQELSISPALPRNLIGVCASSNRWALERLMQGKNEVLTYGMGSCDTLTCSSLSDETAVLSLRRQILPLHGAPVEPGEFPIRLNRSYAPECILAAGAAFLLAGKMPEAF